MFDATTDLKRAIFAKTSQGQQEIATRAQGLNPMQRRLLILIDGKRNGAELAPMVVGQDLREMIGLLLEKTCIEMIGKSAETARADAKPASTEPVAVDIDPVLAGLPAAQSRTAKEVDMARNFMMNTLNAAFGNHYCISLIESISQSSDAEKLRQNYDEWFKTMSSSRSSAKDLPVLLKKLASVL